MGEKGLVTSDALREQRIENYRVKSAADFKCQHEGCEHDVGILVVKANKELTTRCRDHIGKLQYTAGQWVDRVPEDG